MEKLIEILENLGFPYCYDHFAEKENPEPPFLAYLTPETNNFFADGVVYEVINSVLLELYTAKKDPETEKTVETALMESGIAWEKNSVWLPNEDLYLTTYNFEMEENEYEQEE